MAWSFEVHGNVPGDNPDMQSDAETRISAKCQRFADELQREFGDFVTASFFSSVQTGSQTLIEPKGAKTEHAEG